MVNSSGGEEDREARKKRDNAQVDNNDDDDDDDDDDGIKGHQKRNKESERDEKSQEKVRADDNISKTNVPTPTPTLRTTVRKLIILE